VEVKMEIKKENIKKVLSEVIDPEFGMDIVSLGFVKNIKIEESKVTINLKLTTPGCPLTSFFLEEIKDKVGKIKGISEVKVKLID
jgi:metal-sulfur cluster biosynthetic enzyme